MITPEIVMILIGIILAIVLGLFNMSRENTTDKRIVDDILREAEWVKSYNTLIGINEDNAKSFDSDIILTTIDIDLIPLQDESFLDYIKRYIKDNVKGDKIDQRFITGLHITLYIGYSHLHVTRQMIVDKIINMTITNSNSIHNNIILYIQSLPNWEQYYKDELKKNIFYDPTGKNNTLTSKNVNNYVTGHGTETYK